MTGRGTVGKTLTDMLKQAPEGAEGYSRLGTILRLTAFAVFAWWNAWLLYGFVGWGLDGLPTNDYSLFASLDPAAPYGSWFKWSLPAAYAISWIATSVPFWLWSALHLVALLTIRPRVVVAIALVTFPFWADVASGNILTFVFVAAWHGLSGSRVGAVAFVMLAVLVPRPIMLPVLAYLVWHRPEARVAFVVSAAVVGGLALATGTLGPWVVRLLEATGPELGASWNLGPSKFLGVAWVPVGLVLGVFLTWRGRLGLASLTLTPYLIHYYAILVLLELCPVAHRPAGRVAHRPGRRALQPQVLEV